MEELRKLKLIRSHLRRINKPAVKTIQSPDGDIIDCVLSHEQPAFDHPKLRGQRPLDPPERPKGHSTRNHVLEESFQLWSMSNEFCPEGTIPIRRTAELDILRASSIHRFGKKIRPIKRDSSSNIHEHAVGYVSGQEYYGAKASINVWTPRVASPYEFSLSQMWVIAGSFGDDLNTIEAGWQASPKFSSVGIFTNKTCALSVSAEFILEKQVSPELYGDNYPRFFTYWTSDAYQATGCYNLLCSGFIQTNNRIAVGAAISPTSSMLEAQSFCLVLFFIFFRSPLIPNLELEFNNQFHQDPKHGNWWLEFGNGVLVGYWPSILFTHLREHATMVQFGGEIVNTQTTGTHTTTQMGSGHFAEEGFGKSAYFRNLQVVDWDNSLIPLSDLRVLADHPSCYNIRGGVNRVWGNYFYYGGPGKTTGCP